VWGVGEGGSHKQGGTHRMNGEKKKKKKKKAFVHKGRDAPLSAGEELQIPNSQTSASFEIIGYLRARPCH